ncbi:helix-turn-helix domain-containing protein [Paraprevotella clara]|uniref:helix-turn-helix domain-containing protein n=1 Tax=Paraprevotella clara TaxID=454154 RepID=UPI003A8CA542
MGEIKKISTVHDFNALLGVEDRHPLISVIDFSAYPPRPLFRALLGVYGIYIREDEPQNVVYGTSKYDFLGGTLIAIAPGQISGAEDIGHPVQRKGWAILFDAELLHGTSLAQKIRQYTFFSYEVNEALHMQDSERETIVECLKHIRKELSGPQDEYNRTILVAYIEVLLNYCMRFYGRQFATRKAASKDILARFERLLTEYFDSGEQTRHGLPNVQECAERLSLSPNYFGDLVKRETGETPHEHIQRFLIERVKKSLAEGGKTISEIAYDMGFNYPHHLSRMFKNATGMSPKEYVTALKLK